MLAPLPTCNLIINKVACSALCVQGFWNHFKEMFTVNRYWCCLNTL